MSYKAKSPQVILILYLLLNISSIITNNSHGFLLFLQIFVCIFIILGIFIHYHFRIDESILEYQILLFSIPIYKKVVSPKEIIHIKLKRVDLAKKGAFIKVAKGFNIRIINFEPKDITLQLITFSNKNNIPVIKHKHFPKI